MDNLKFRRQFLFSAQECLQLKSWDILQVGTHYLYTHPDCEVTKVRRDNVDVILIGHIVDPKLPNYSTQKILEDIALFNTIDDISSTLYGLVGRFVLLIKHNDTFTFFHDACGLKMLFYTKYKDELYAASQPLLLEMITNVSKSKNYQTYYDSEYVKEVIEHWIPSGISLYTDVYQLVPNHYLKGSTLEQIRYWPVEQLIKDDFESSVEKFVTILKETMLAANKRYDLALPLTAGWDSRIILGCYKDISKDIWSYTLKYRDLTEESNDIKIPRNLSKKLGFKHTVIDCRKPLDKIFSEIYTNNTDIPHIDDWGKIAYGMYDDYPTNRLAVKGNVSEVGRCFYFPSGKHNKINSSKDFLELEPYWKNIDFIEERISEWFEEVKQENIHLGYDLYDLFYWEHRIGSWQAQSQLEWDIVQETFSPFNNRELLDTMLRTNPIHRVGSKNVLFKEAMKKLWPEALTEPINPLTKKQKIKNNIKKFLVKIGIFDKLKSN